MVTTPDRAGQVNFLKSYRTFLKVISADLVCLMVRNKC